MAATSYLPARLYQYGEKVIKFRATRDPSRLVLFDVFGATAGARLHTRTELLFRALAREIVRGRLESGSNPVESSLIAGDEAERALLAFLTDDDKRELGLL